jgi:hypothetical protein
MRTAFAEKHAIYSSFNGPGSNGMSIDDFFAPEIDSQAVEPNGVPYPVDGAWTDDNAARAAQLQTTNPPAAAPCGPGPASDSPTSASGRCTGGYHYNPVWGALIDQPWIGERGTGAGGRLPL